MALLANHTVTRASNGVWANQNPCLFRTSRKVIEQVILVVGVDKSSQGEIFRIVHVLPPSGHVSLWGRMHANLSSDVYVKYAVNGYENWTRVQHVLIYRFRFPVISRRHHCTKSHSFHVSTATNSSQLIYMFNQRGQLSVPPPPKKNDTHFVHISKPSLLFQSGYSTLTNRVDIPS